MKVAASLVSKAIGVLYDDYYCYNNAKQKHLWCKKVRGQSEATLQTARRDQKV